MVLNNPLTRPYFLGGLALRGYTSILMILSWLEAGVIPEDKIGNFGGSWSALSEAGEATNLNLVHKKGDLECKEKEGETQTKTN